MLAAHPIIGWTIEEQTPRLLNARIVDPLLQKVPGEQYVRTIWYEARDQHALDVVQFATVELYLARENALEQCVDMPMKLSNREYHEISKARKGELGKRPAKFYSGWQNAVRLLNNSPALAERVAEWAFDKDNLDHYDYETLISKRVSAQRIGQVLAEFNSQDGDA
ncbi:hypothetical protein [Salicola sp. Rm-C-2C1-2]|uniref:hypothetical protein n=1 Tax=Salicola sp. Rm-C-2C1-2 TaxID=3141321 RepID=UPI0032E4090C